MAGRVGNEGGNAGDRASCWVFVTGCGVPLPPRVPPDTREVGCRGFLADLSRALPPPTGADQLRAKVVEGDDDSFFAVAGADGVDAGVSQAAQFGEAGLRARRIPSRMACASEAAARWPVSPSVCRSRRRDARGLERREVGESRWRAAASARRRVRAKTPALRSQGRIPALSFGSGGRRGGNEGLRNLRLLDADTGPHADRSPSARRRVANAWAPE